MKKALLISYRFPPQGGGGVQRTLKHVKYLRSFGWEPVVQTARNPYWPVRDETLLGDVPPSVRVYRTAAFEFERFEHRLASLLQRSRTARNGAPAGAARATGADRRARPGPAIRAPGGTGAEGEAPISNGGSGGVLGGLRGAVHRRLLVPDPQIAWLPGALAHALSICRRERPQVIYTSSPPNSVQLLGGLLAAILRRPWVADFRDPWTDGPRRQRAYVGNRMRAGIERAAERWVLRRADWVIVSAPALRERFLAKYAFLRPERVEVLTNGFDPADFEPVGSLDRQLEPGCFHVTGTGNIETMFDARPLLRAIAELAAENAEVARDLRVNLVGAKRGKYDADLAALGLSERVRYPGWVAHARSVQYLRESDVLLMCQLTQAGGGSEKLSGKCFEYLYLQKPILCLTVPGVTADLMTESGLGTVVDPADQAGIKAALGRLYADRGRAARGNPAVIARFDRRRLTERLAAIFDDLVGADTPARDAGAAAGVAQ
jgi:glycosyltransferase involved in cell wall biosynthesis